MLVLSRKAGTEIVFGPKRDYVIKVVKLEELNGAHYVEFTLTCPTPTLVVAEYASEIEVERAAKDQTALEHRFWMGKNSAITLGDDIRFDIVDIRPLQESVRIGGSVPKDYPLHRREVWEAIQRAGGG